MRRVFDAEQTLSERHKIQRLLSGCRDFPTWKIERQQHGTLTAGKMLEHNVANAHDSLFRIHCTCGNTFEATAYDWNTGDVFCSCNPEMIRWEIPSMFQDMRIGIILQCLGKLEGRQAQVITLRWGLDGSGEHTLREIGKRFGVTHERIRQIETKAMCKLKWHATHQPKLKTPKVVKPVPTIREHSTATRRGVRKVMECASSAVKRRMQKAQAYLKMRAAERTAKIKVTT